MMIEFEKLRQAEGILEMLTPLKNKIEQKINLTETTGKEKAVALGGNKIMRICLLAGLAMAKERDMSEIARVQISKQGNRFNDSLYTYGNVKPVVSAMLKLRYIDKDVNWQDATLISRIIGYEMMQGMKLLSEEHNLNKFLLTESSAKGKTVGRIPVLDLVIGAYGDGEMEATLDLNSRSVTNTQILIAGATGSGKSNLLAVLLNQLRSISTETAYPVNFLLFDYKGEFSDPANNAWLTLFDVDRTAILDPVQKPLPFTPFKDFTGKSVNEINLYSTEMAEALCAIEKANISANMSNRLSLSIVECYKTSNGKPITFSRLLKEYREQKGDDKVDSVISVLEQLVRNNLFAESDEVSLVEESLIVKMDAFPKDGPIAKAIVYFIISKLNNIYEQLEKQEQNEEVVQLRHFTIIDEAHYMLDFDNRPLRNLIAVGRNKGLSIILATQNMASYKSRYFDFYANAQYPLIMKQQTIDDKVLRDIFGVSGKELADLRTAVNNLQKGELIIKDNNAMLLGIGRCYKTIKVTHLI